MSNIFDTTRASGRVSVPMEDLVNRIPKVEPSETPEIVVLLDIWESHMKDLCHALEELDKRMSPILREEPDNKTQERVPSALSAKTQLGSLISLKISHIRDSIKLVNSLVHRMEI